MTTPPPPPNYRVEIEDSQWETIQTFPRADIDLLLAFLKNHAAHTPTLLVPGHLKALKGDYRGHYQLTLSGGRRFIYTVDENAKRAQCQYVGRHPDWDKSRGGAIRR